MLETRMSAAVWTYAGVRSSHIGKTSKLSDVIVVSAANIESLPAFGCLGADSEEMHSDHDLMLSDSSVRHCFEF